MAKSKCANDAIIDVNMIIDLRVMIGNVERLRTLLLKAFEG